MRSREEIELLIRTHIVDIPLAMVNFQILLTFDLHRLANDANENHNYIACQFIL